MGAPPLLGAQATSHWSQWPSCHACEWSRRAADAGVNPGAAARVAGLLLPLEAGLGAPAGDSDLRAKRGGGGGIEDDELGCRAMIGSRERLPEARAATLG